jgi:molybdenum cofactor cytidylyltransferase
MSASIRAGIEAIATAELEAVVLALCDQPFVSSQVINRVVRAYQSAGKPIVASEYGGTLGVPALFDRTFFPELTTMQGATGAKRTIEKYLHEVSAVSFPEGAIDIDTPSDYDRLTSFGF